MRRISGSISRLLAATACFALMSTSAVALPGAIAVRAGTPKTVPITIPLSIMPRAAAAWSPANERYEARRHWKLHRHNDGFDGGDVLVGLLVLGGIAAVAGSIDKSGYQQRERRSGGDYPQRPYDYRGDDWRGDEQREEDWRGQQPSSSRAMDRAVEACSAEAARTGRIDEIYAVDRIDGEWRVRGDYEGGGQFTCTVDSSGRAYVGNNR